MKKKKTRTMGSNNGI